ncbi:MAG: SDR family oxidoreductase [Bacteroidales bacterium]|nr:SDR family oxidoreductase [Bacteroidales bacterium]
MKTVLITGASSGIGKETAYVFAENKYNLVLAARRKENLEVIKKEIEEKQNVKVDIFDIDLSKTDSAEQLYNQVKAANIPVDVLINNAGFGINGFFKDIDISKEESMLILNIITLTKLTKLFVKDMVKNKNGHIINIASTAAFQGVPKFATYAASKAYVLHFSEAIANELKNDNVKVTVINPGATKSEFADTAGFKGDVFSKAPTSRDLAEFIFLSMKKGKVSAIHGFKNKMLAFSTRMTPRQLLTTIAGKMME